MLIQVRLLISAGAKPTLNALNMAIVKQNEALVKYLLKHKAPTTSLSLILALRTGCATIVRQLLAHNCKGSKSPKMLREAVKTRNAMMVQLILEAGCEFDPEGLINSVMNNDVDIIKVKP
jgi:ankyrin repeat protein